MAVHTNPNKKYWAEFTFLILIPVIFMRAFTAPYVSWDDDVLVLNNPLLQLPFWDALKNSFQVYYHGDYFPLTLMSYWLDAQFSGFGAPFQHIENLCLHFLSVLILFRLLRSLSQNEVLSFFVTLVYALHPLQMESVMWISERKSLLAAVFTFLSLSCYLKTFLGPKKHIWYGLSVLCFILMGLTKATGLLLPFLFLLLDWKMLNRNSGSIMKRFLPIALLAGLLVYLRIQAYSSSATEAPAALFDPNRLMQVPLMALSAIGFYLKMFFFPSSYSPIYRDFEISATSIQWMAVATVFLLVIGMYLWRRGNLFLWFCAGWFLLFLAPVLQIIPRINFVNDRYMYLPIVGLTGIFFYWLQEKAPSHLKIGKACLAAAVILSVSMGLQSFTRSEAFASNRNLWTQALKVVPENLIALNNLGLDYQQSGDLDKAVEYYNKAAAQPTNSLQSIALGNLAAIYSDRKYAGYDPAKAIQLYQQGISRVQRVRDTYELRINLALTYKDLGQTSDSRDILQAVIQDLSQERDYKFQTLKTFAEKHLQRLPQ